MKYLLIGPLLVAALLRPGSAQAATCAITNVTPIAFGAYSPFSGANVDSAGSVTYQCSVFGILDRVVIDLSTGSSGSYFPRTMLSGARALAYNLYTTPARTTVWGDNSGGTAHYGPAILNLFAITVPIYGRIPGGQNAWQGSYADTVTITMIF